MKLGRNDPCHCGSGKKYKHCCLHSVSNQQNQIMAEVDALLAMNPNLTIDEINLVLNRRMQDRNNQPLSDFCGISPNQMNNWINAPFDKLQGLTINTPSDFSASPVMRYLQLILDEAMSNDGSFKATAKGNLPLKIVNQANALLPEFAVSQFDINISISEFAGRNEDDFYALHYTRVLAEVCGIIYLRSGRYHVKKAAQKQYQTSGLQVFFKPMLEAAIKSYNWGYMDRYEYDVDLRLFWAFMLWRIQSHSSLEQLVDEVVLAFPDLLPTVPNDAYFEPKKYLGNLIELRFLSRFLGFWGFVVVDPLFFLNKKTVSKPIQTQPLLSNTFVFNISKN